MVRMLCVASVMVVGLGCDGGGGSSVPDAPDAAIDAPPDAPEVAIDEPPECAGDPLLAHQGDVALVVSAFEIPGLGESFDLDNDGLPDNKMAALSSLAHDSVLAALAAGTFVVPIEIFDRGTDPDACLKLALYRGTCATPGCDLTDGTPDTLVLDPATIGPNDEPISRLRVMSTDVNGQLSSLPGFLDLLVPVTADVPLPMPITVQRVTGAISAAGLTQLTIGGTMQAFRLDTREAPQVPQLGTAPGDTVLDVFFANLFGPLVALPKHPLMTACRTADIDVDGDGLEGFCDSDPNDEIKRVDTCIDGDGTIIRDGDGGVARCSQALLDGVPRFKDGISVAIRLDARPATIAP